MKTRLLTRTCLLVSVLALNFAFSPASMAQVPANPPTTPASPDSQASTKTTDSMADQHSGSAAAASQAPGTLDNNSKTGTTTLDSNPSLAPTGSANKSATKTPTGTEDETKSGSMHHKGGNKMFVMKASQGGMLEVALGKVAQDKASASDVKDFGSKMVTDHSAANDKLMALAKQKGMTVPPDLDAMHQGVVDRLSKLSGPAFDKAYVSEMLKDHKADAALFQNEIDTTQDADFKAFATDTLQTVKMHLDMIKQIHAGMMKK